MLVIYNYLPWTAQPPSTTSKPTMKVLICLSQVALALPLFQCFVAAFPPTVPAHTTATAPDAPATRIITSRTSITSTTPTRTATDTLQYILQPPNTFPSPILNLNVLLGPRSNPPSLAIAPPPSPPMDPLPTGAATTVSTDMTITPFTFPSDIPDDAQAPQAKWHLTTFWSCVTDNVQTHCGWHEPVLPGGTDIAAAPRDPMPANRRGLLAAALAAAVVVGEWLF